MADELSKDEVKSLLARTDRGTGPTDSDEFGRTPLPYDFRRPSHVRSDQMRAVENIHEQFARRFSSSFSASMRMIVDVDLAFVDQVMHSEFVTSLSNPCCAYEFTMTPPGATAVLAFSNDLVMAVVDRSFGGKGATLEQEPRALTPIETKVVNRVASGLLRDLERSWEPVGPLEIGDVELETNPDFLRGIAPGEPLVLVAFEITSTRPLGLVRLGYPITSFTSLLARLAPRDGAPEPVEGKEESQPSPTLDRIQLDVKAQIARGTVRLRDLATLRPGDVIRLDTTRDEPAVIFVGSRPKFLARAGLDGTRRAVKLTGIVDPEDEDAYR